MVNYIIIAVVAAIVGLAIHYIRREKRKGIQCVGCPESSQCAGSGTGGCGGGCIGCPGKCKSNQF